MMDALNIFLSQPLINMPVAGLISFLINKQLSKKDKQIAELEIKNLKNELLVTKNLLVRSEQKTTQNTIFNMSFAEQLKSFYFHHEKKINMFCIQCYFYKNNIIILLPIGEQSSLENDIEHIFKMKKLQNSLVYETDILVKNRFSDFRIMRYSEEEICVQQQEILTFLLNTFINQLLDSYNKTNTFHGVFLPQDIKNSLVNKITTMDFLKIISQIHCCNWRNFDASDKWKDTKYIKHNS